MLIIVSSQACHFQGTFLDFIKQFRNILGRKKAILNLTNLSLLHGIPELLIQGHRCYNR